MSKEKKETKKIVQLKENKIVYIGPNLYDKGLIHGKVFSYEPKHLVESIPGIKNVLIPVSEFTKNKTLINKQGSKYDFFIKEFQEGLKK